jgi:hypothetical protein
VMEALRSSKSLVLTRASNIPRLLSPWWWRRYVPPNRWFLQEPLTSQKTSFFIDWILFAGPLATISVMKIIIVGLLRMYSKHKERPLSTDESTFWALYAMSTFFIKLAGMSLMSADSSRNQDKICQSKSFSSYVLI